MSNVQAIIEHAEQSCKKHGTRLTDKRKQVLSGLLQSRKALSAYELASYCQKAFGTAIPAMSVYRILDFLQGEHLAHKLQLANKYIACTHITCSHKHGIPQFLICTECQQVKEISVTKSTITELQSNVENAGFHLVKPQLEINCLCQNCLPSNN